MSQDRERLAIHTEDREATPRKGSALSGHPHLGRRKPLSPSLYTYLLDADDDLAQEFDVRMRLAVRQVATARVLDAEVGACDLSRWFEAVDGGPGLLVLDGLVAIDARVGNRTATELIGPGDLLQPACPLDENLLERSDAWRALCPTRFALLDRDFAERVRPWPQIAHALLRRAGRRIADLDVLRAITSQPRLEVRLVLLLWHLAARWGRVEPAGIRVSLPLTHRMLGQLVGAERPSISHALARLAHAGMVTGAAGDWHLHGTVEDHLEALIEKTVKLGEQAVPNGQSNHPKLASGG
ncbi:MAG TPA: helix-turn-helix domain-containing protein [Solirubrobacteraceae bacterium]|nr:helix-turn-helix domain-containing protein [Solirubrobacteraceae bacterium]